jgi:hypothetical protein
MQIGTVKFCISNVAFCIRVIREMDISVDVWLRGDNHATTYVINPVLGDPRSWTESDVSAVLVGMLRALERARNPEAPADRPVALRGFSWIVNRFDEGGVVIALELSIGAIVAGPFDIAERDLSAMIENVMTAEAKATRDAEAAVSARSSAAPKRTDARRTRTETVH